MFKLLLKKLEDTEPEECAEVLTEEEANFLLALTALMDKQEKGGIVHRLISSGWIASGTLVYNPVDFAIVPVKASEKVLSHFDGVEKEWADLIGKIKVVEGDHECST